jgi:hypothetical protein
LLFLHGELAVLKISLYLKRHNLFSRATLLVHLIGFAFFGGEDKI